AAVSRDDTRDSPEDVLVSLDGGHEQGVVGTGHNTDVGDQSAFRLLHLHHLTELGRLSGFAAAEDLRVRLEDADDLLGRFRVALEDARFRLRDDLSADAGKALEVLNASACAPG